MSLKETTEEILNRVDASTTREHVKLKQASFTAQKFSISQLYFLMDEL